MTIQLISLYTFIVCVLVGIDAVYQPDYWSHEAEPLLRLRFNESAFRNTRDFDKDFNMDELRTFSVKTRSRGRHTTKARPTSPRRPPGRPSTSFLQKNLTKKSHITIRNLQKKRRGRPVILCDEERLSKIASLRAVTTELSMKTKSLSKKDKSTKPMSA